ncbi:dermonecrotic toxin domain-containing protein [Pseudomonas mandelii]|uniref:dermonecrotic toxin domain-containing protein n=1 Tax=Pseudomonas mandelii TaxID=75612 RepID=UPI00224AEA52|nr:DUF6543 domain-containing protein [Pseudomonas mandelii]MCX2900801.1 NEL-type E3 ubiquitin ligase domain-containing protein [Pseudomonas mandelii]
MTESHENHVTDKYALPALPLREELQAAVATALPQSPGDFGGRLIQARWGKDVDPQTARLVTLDYNYHGHPVQNGIQQGRVASSQSLTQMLLANYQTVGDGRFGETGFGLYTPPDIGPEVRIVDKVDEFAYVGSGNHDTYEGIYRRTDPQAYGPLTQIALRPADFKQWVWELELKDQYRDYVERSWPADEVIVAPAPYALRTSVKAALVMTAYLQSRENTLTRKGLELAMQMAGLAPDQQWEHLKIEQLQAPTRVPQIVEIGRLIIYRYTATDIWTCRCGSRILLYIPGNSSPLHDFVDANAFHGWVVQQGRNAQTKRALAAHFAEGDQQDGTFHAGVLTALDGMAIYPNQHRLQKGHGFFNDDGYWDPADYLHFEVAPRGTDPFAQLVVSMKLAAIASIETIRDDAQVNRDNLSAVVEPIVQWVNKFGPLALFVPGGEGLLALAGIIDAGYGLDQAVNGKNPEDMSAGVTRTVFGLLNALPMVLGAGAAIESEGVADAEVAAEPLLKDDLPVVDRPTIEPLPATRTRVDLIRGIGAEVASFSDEVLEQIGRVSTVDDDMLRLMRAGRPPTPLLADTISRFRIDQDLQDFIPQANPATTRAQLFQARYDALQESEHAWVRLFQRQYPGLPKNAIEQILDRSGVDIQAPPAVDEARRMLSQLDGKATEYQQHVRLNRAYEGLFLKSIDNPETDSLVLHSLKALPGWSKAFRLEVIEGSAGGRLLDHVGPINAPVRRSLVKIGKRYQRYDAQGLPQQDTNDIYQAVFDVLPEAQRSALELETVEPVRDLQHKISERLLTRSELKTGLDRIDSGLTFDAQGLQGGGYPMTAQGEAISQSHDIGLLQLKSIYPDFTAAQASEFVQRLGTGPLEALRQLQIKLAQVNVDLTAWINQVRHDVGDLEVELLGAGDEAAQGMDAAQIEEENIERVETAAHYEREARIELATELMSLWQKRGHAESRLYDGEQFLGYKLELDFEEFHSLPRLSAKFTDVIELSMQKFRLTLPEGLDGFLECFPNLRTLNMEGAGLQMIYVRGVWEGVLPRSIPSMLNLTSLSLKSTELVLTEQAAGQLADLAHLQVLDLSNNPLGRPPVIMGLTELRQLNLSHTGITRCPLGLSDQPQLQLLDLSNNRLTRIPEEVFAQAVARDRVQLWGNALTDESTLQRIVAHREQTGINLWLSAPIADGGQPGIWLQRLPEAQLELKRLLRQRLQAKPGATRFLRTFEALGRTADFQVSYPALQARIWNLLDQADASNELWGLVSRDIAISALDAENPFVSFMRLEDRVRLYRDWVQMGRPIAIDDLL